MNAPLFFWENQLRNLYYQLHAKAPIEKTTDFSKNFKKSLTFKTLGKKKSFMAFACLSNCEQDNKRS